ncbi:MAG: transposase [Nitrosomonas sp.]|nr:transposase [Nitrosomonas sp.]
MNRWNMTNSNPHFMPFLGLSLKVDVPDHSVLSRSRFVANSSKK